MQPPAFFGCGADVHNGERISQDPDYPRGSKTAGVALALLVCIA
jgi:hypothetical protein